MISRRQAERALEIHGDELSSYPNVVGVGVRWAGGGDRPDPGSDYAVAVYVSNKVPPDELGPDGLVPGYVEIPGRGRVHKVAVRVIEVGDLEEQGADTTDDDERGSSAFSAE